MPQQIINIVESLPGAVGIFVCVISYLVLLLLIRWKLIAKPVRASLRSQIEQVRTLVPSESPITAGAHELLDKADEFLDHSRRSGYLWWSQGQELAAWSLIHRAERMIYSNLPAENARARLESTVEELRPQSEERATNLVKRVDKLFAQLDPPPNENQINALLGEVLALVYEQRDREFTVLVTWHNKALWLIYVTLALILAASWLGGAQVLLVGAVGGLLSRLGRVHRATNLPTDYGAYWTTLFFSPLVGALAAWGGFLLLAAFRELGIQILGNGLPKITLNVQKDISLFGIAFVLGFSERIFNSLFSTLEEREARRQP
jgi:hypothetical protein